MQLTGGQSKFEFITNGASLSEQNSDSNNYVIDHIDNLPRIKASKSEIKDHEVRISDIEKKHSTEAIWRKY